MRLLSAVLFSLVSSMAVAGSARFAVDLSLSQPVNLTRVHLIDGTLGAPALSWLGDKDTGFYLSGADTIAMVSDGVLVSLFHSAAINVQTDLKLNGNDLLLGSGSATKIVDGGSDGDIILSNAAGTQGIKLDTSSSANTLTVTDESGNAADIEVYTLTVDGVVYTNQVRGRAFGDRTRVYSRSGAPALITGDTDIYSGANSNAGDYGTGDVNVYAGGTTTDGDVGDVNIFTDTAGAGAPDGGDVFVSVNGAPGSGTTVLSALGSLASLDLFAITWEDLDSTCTINQIRGDNGGATPELCICANTDTWYCIAIDDTTGPAD